MISREEYIQTSLENNLFWTRIMKEHATFIESVLTPPLKNLAPQADEFKKIFEGLLENTIQLANESVSAEALQSGEFITRFTDEAERLTQDYTGIAINRNLTYTETLLEPSMPGMEETEAKEKEVSQLNQNIINHLSDFLKFKATLLNSQASCKVVTFEYTAVLEHILEEGRKFMEILTTLQKREMPVDIHLESPQEQYFWNMIMADHAKVMRGKFDPIEKHFFNEANRYAMIYDSLTEANKEMHNKRAMNNGVADKETTNNESADKEITNNEAANKETTNNFSPSTNNAAPINVYDVTADFSDFKAFTTQGIIECKVRSLMLPLFTDHLLREANHYIRLMKNS
jgi:hypothetical protein